MSRRNTIRLAGFYRRLEDTYQCSYCGSYADSWDHFIPVSVRSALIDIGLFAPSQCVMLRCCRECNSIAGAKLFRTIGGKRRYLQARLKRRYAKYLRIPYWSTKEIEALEWNMKSLLLQSLAVQRYTRQRITYRAALCVTSRSNRTDSGNGFVRLSADEIFMLMKQSEPVPC